MGEVTDYQKSAALMAQDIEILFECAERDPDKAFEFFKKLKSMRDDVISDKEIRDSRYFAMASLFAAGRSGAIKCTKVS